MRSSGRVPSLGDMCGARALAGAGRRWLLEVGTWRERERDEEEAWATKGPPEGIRVGWVRKIQSETE